MTLEEAIVKIQQRRIHIALARDWNLASEPPNHPESRIEELDFALEIIRQVKP